VEYLRHPTEIYAQSFATIKDEADISRFGVDQQDLAIRLIHACGMVDIADDLVFGGEAIAAGRLALASGAPIICDVRMVAQGVIGRNLTAGNEVLCGLDEQGAREFAEQHGTTRSAGGIEVLKDRIPGSIVVIGNAPTALFHLLERIDQALAKPALILGFPVGFVGAAESKNELISNARGIPFVTLKGRRGGSALAAAAVNAIAVGLGT